MSSAVADRVGKSAIVPASDRLRIAVLSYGLPVVGRKRGGIERVAHDIADGLARRGHHVTVYSHDERPEGAAYHVKTLSWKRFVNTWLGRRLTMGYLGNVLMLLPPLAEFDAVIAHGDSLLLPFKGRPVVRVLHGSAWEEARSADSVGRRILQAGVYVQELMTAAFSQSVVGVSDNTRAANPFVRRVIPNGVDRHVFQPDPAARARMPTLLFVGSLTGRKRGAWLLELFRSAIQPRVPHAELRMVCARGPRHPGVTYHLGVSDEDLARLYRLAWLYVSPSAYEGFGLPYVEALACGTPVVATPNPGSIEVLRHCGAGILAEDEQMAPAIVDLLADESRRRAMTIAALRRAEAYDLNRTIDAYDALLRTLLSERRPPHHG